MDFEFSDEQRQLREAVEGFATKEYTFDRLRAIKRSGVGWDPAVWRGLAELGVTALNVPAALGGLGYGPTETLALMDASGPSLLLEPILTSAVIATALLRQFDGRAGCRTVARHGRGRSDRGAGSLRTQFALRDPLGRDARDPRGPGISARRPQGGGGLMRDLREALLVSARSSGEAGDAAGGVAVRGAARNARTHVDRVSHRRRAAGGRHLAWTGRVPESSRLGGEGERSRRSRRPSTWGSPPCARRR